MHSGYVKKVPTSDFGSAEGVRDVRDLRRSTVPGSDGRDFAHWRACPGGGFVQCHAVQHHNPRHVYPRGDEGTYARETGLVWASADPMPDAAHTGSAMAPEPVVRVGSLGLVGGGDYTLPYANNVSPGTATVTVTGKGDLCGTKSATFTITRAGDFPDAPPREASSSNLTLY